MSTNVDQFAYENLRVESKIKFEPKINSDAVIVKHIPIANL